MAKSEKESSIFTYDESSIKSLDWREHIRLRPGMYIGKLGDGSSKDDGIYVLVKEVVDNCIDEHMMGYGKNIDVHITESKVTVRDYGRGIPLGKVVDVVSKINTGAKYDAVIPEILSAIPADHGALWADFGGDGAVDLSLTGQGPHAVLANELPAPIAQRSLRIRVVDRLGRATRTADRWLGHAVHEAERLDGEDSRRRQGFERQREETPVAVDDGRLPQFAEPRLQVKG